MKNNLIRLYKRIHECHLCPEMNSKKAFRIPHAVDESMDVFIISQALAEKQLRLSGVNFFTSDGILGSTGRNLEKFLNNLYLSFF